VVRHQGGGHKRAYRTIDFKRDKFGVPGKVVTIEYDPNRSARIALIHYADGEKRYILQPEGLKPAIRSFPGRKRTLRSETPCRWTASRKEPCCTISS